MVSDGRRGRAVPPGRRPHPPTDVNPREDVARGAGTERGRPGRCAGRGDTPRAVFNAEACAGNRLASARCAAAMGGRVGRRAPAPAFQAQIGSVLTGDDVHGVVHRDVHDGHGANLRQRSLAGRHRRGQRDPVPFHDGVFRVRGCRRREHRSERRGPHDQPPPMPGGPSRHSSENFDRRGDRRPSPRPRARCEPSPRSSRVP